MSLNAIFANFALNKIRKDRSQCGIAVSTLSCLECEANIVLLLDGADHLALPRLGEGWGQRMGVVFKATITEPKTNPCDLALSLLGDCSVPEADRGPSAS